jgi:hypothetical protein
MSSSNPFTEKKAALKSKPKSPKSVLTPQSMSELTTDNKVLQDLLGTSFYKSSNLPSFSKFPN